MSPSTPATTRFAVARVRFAGIFASEFPGLILAKTPSGRYAVFTADGVKICGISDNRDGSYSPRGERDNTFPTILDAARDIAENYAAD